MGAGLTSGVQRLNVAGVARVLLVVGAGVGLVHFATVQPVGIDLAAAAGEEQTPLVGTSLATRVAQTCPGPELSGIAGLPDVPVPATISVAAGPADLLPVPARGAGELTATSGATKLLALDSRPGEETVAMSRVIGPRTPPGSDPVLLIGQGAMAPAIAGTQEWLLNSTDLRGLVTTPCGAGGSDLWLLGGGSGPGRQERLVLTNPGANPVSAEVSVHGTSGRLGDPVVETVAPGGRVSVLLDARYGAETTPAVHVRSGGGGVQATLTDTWVAGSTALGAETTVPAATPGTVVVVPGVVVDADGSTAVRVAVPGERGAVVRFSVLDRDGLVPLKGESVLSVPAGAVGELPLAGLPDGTFSVTLRADVPVVASAFTRIGTGKVPGDFAWSPATTGVGSLGGAAFRRSDSVARTAHLVSTGGNATAEVITVVDGERRSREVELLADRVATAPLDGATSVWVRRITGSGELRGTIVSSSGTGRGRLLSSMPLSESMLTSEVSRAFPLP